MHSSWSLSLWMYLVWTRFHYLHNETLLLPKYFTYYPNKMKVMRASISPLFQTLWQPELNLHCHNHHECLFYSDFTRHSWDLTTQWESLNGNWKDSKVMKDTFSTDAIWALKKSGQTLGLEDRIRQERGK